MVGERCCRLVGVGRWVDGEVDKYGFDEWMQIMMGNDGERRWCVNLRLSYKVQCVISSSIYTIKY